MLQFLFKYEDGTSKAGNHNHQACREAHVEMNPAKKYFQSLSYRAYNYFIVTGNLFTYNFTENVAMNWVGAIGLIL